MDVSYGKIWWLSERFESRDELKYCMIRLAHVYQPFQSYVYDNVGVENYLIGSASKTAKFYVTRFEKCEKTF